LSVLAQEKITVALPMFSWAKTDNKNRNNAMAIKNNFLIKEVLKKVKA